MLIQSHTPSIIALKLPRMEILFVLLFAYMRRLRFTKLQKTARLIASRTRRLLPVTLK